ncbi:MAG: efflux RND transporter permease subunit, partial [Deltaproteobacteria bacterium]|nr:efflux RND transporter permease subunit [Deltaproteobacteria bacterium]
TYLRASFPDLEVKVKGPSAGPPVDNPIEVRISGTDSNRIFTIADQVKAKLRTMNGPKTITDDWGSRAKKLLVEVDRTAALRAGVSNQDIAVSMLTNLSGLQTSEFREDDQVIPIIMRSEQAENRTLGRLDSINVFAQSSGRNVPLKQVADTRIVWEPAKVIRRDGLRTVSVRAQLESEITAAEINAELIPWLQEQKQSWPIGYRFSIGGEKETSGKANESIAAKMPIAGFIILLLLISQFNSVRKTLIILFTIPMALIGVVIGLLVVRSYFGFMTLLGIVSLAGIVINNAIVLLERIQQEIDDNGLAPNRAVIAAAQQRLRPILLTTATTIGGLLPLYLSGGAMWEPMAIAIMFGLAFSTVLTLGIIPVLYSAFYRVKYRDFEW